LVKKEKTEKQEEEEKPEEEEEKVDQPSKFEIELAAKIDKLTDAVNRLSKALIKQEEEEEEKPKEEEKQEEEEEEPEEKVEKGTTVTVSTSEEKQEEEEEEKPPEEEEKSKEAKLLEFIKDAVDKGIEKKFSKPASKRTKVPERPTEEKIDLSMEALSKMSWKDTQILSKRLGSQ